MEGIDVPMKTCRKCGETKAVTEFDIRADTGKPRANCKDCRRKYQKERWQCSTDRSTSNRIIGARELYPCRKCGKLKFASEFPTKARDALRLQSWCKQCFAAYKAERHLKFHDREMARIRGNQARVKAALRVGITQYLAEHPCVDCGETDPVVLDFDHLRDKKWDISRMVAMGLRWELILEEIAKCEVRCANDHRRATKKRRDEARLK